MSTRSALAHKDLVEPLLEQVKSFAQRRSQALVVVRRTRVTATVRAPALDACDSSRESSWNPRWAGAAQEKRVVDDLDAAVLRDLVQRKGQRHIAEAVVVTVALTVGGDVHELWL